MNNFLIWVRENTRFVIVIVIVLIIFSAIVGFLIGTVKRRTQMSETNITDTEIELSTDPFRSKDGKILLLTPAPVLPPMGEQMLGYTFYFDKNDDDLKNMKMLPLKLSELLKYRRIGLNSEIKPFQFQDEELDIITYKEELAEP